MADHGTCKGNRQASDLAKESRSPCCCTVCRASRESCVETGRSVPSRLMEEERGSLCGEKGRYLGEQSVWSAGSALGWVTLGGVPGRDGRAHDGGDRVGYFDSQLHRPRRWTSSCRRSRTWTCGRGVRGREALQGHCILIALGVVKSGRKVVLGLREGSTENAAVVRALLADLVDRGLSTEKPLLRKGTAARDRRRPRRLRRGAALPSAQDPERRSPPARRQARRGAPDHAQGAGRQVREDGPEASAADRQSPGAEPSGRCRLPSGRHGGDRDGTQTRPARHSPADHAQHQSPLCQRR